MGFSGSDCWTGSGGGGFRRQCRPHPRVSWRRGGHPIPLPDASWPCFFYVTVNIISEAARKEERYSMELIGRSKGESLTTWRCLFRVWMDNRNPKKIDSIGDRVFRVRLWGAWSGSERWRKAERRRGVFGRGTCCATPTEGGEASARRNPLREERRGCLCPAPIPVPPDVGNCSAIRRCCTGSRDREDHVWHKIMCGTSGADKLGKSCEKPLFKFNSDYARTRPSNGVPSWRRLPVSKHWKQPTNHCINCMVLWNNIKSLLN